MGFSGYSATPKGFGKTKHCDMGDTPVDPVIPILFVEWFPLKQSRAPLFNKNNTFGLYHNLGGLTPFWLVKFNFLLVKSMIFAG
jgi:hypothetical protein